MNDKEIEKKILRIIGEHSSNPHGITKTELTRIFTERWGTGKTTIWDYIVDMIESGQIELRKTKKIQSALFIPE
ncbi:MAG: hypothetical protein K8Q89_03395 [Nitrosarchaeum sp.]|nr:hypothetical protein [Nitrosarchaeum sp.]